MMDTPSPIEESVIHAVLDYIAHAERLPPQLISKPLRERHYFLNLDVDDEQYLIWPSNDNCAPDAALRHLQSGLHQYSFVAVQYTAPDPAELLLEAHVHITTAERTANDLRLIFRCEEGSWVYHNLALMPFPRNCAPFADTLGIFQSPEDFISEPSYVVSIAGDDDDDSYWNSYGQGDDDSTFKPTTKPHAPIVSSEDAYWAQYSSVHGSADSTVPSPMPEKRSLPAAGSDRVFVPSDTFQPNTAELYNPLEPPSPQSLARRLAELSVRPASPPIVDEDESTDSVPSPHNHPSELDVEESERSYEQSPLATNSAPTPLEGQPVLAGNESNAALQMTIQGLYRLWKADQHHQSKSSDLESFLTVVRNSIEQQQGA